MTFLLLLAALAVAGAGAWMGRRWEIAGRVMMGMGGLGLIGVIALQVRQNLLSPQPKSRNRCEMAVSYGLVNSLLGDLPGPSGSVVLLFPQRREMPEESEENYEDGFTLPLRHSHVKLTLKAVQLDGPAKDLSAFKQSLAQAQEATAIVSYAGVPVGFETLFSSGQSNIPLFYVYDAERTTNWFGALKAGRIRAVVLPRFAGEARAREKISGMPETIFQQYYLLATPASADEVAASLKTQN